VLEPDLGRGDWARTRARVELVERALASEVLEPFEAALLEVDDASARQVARERVARLVAGVAVLRAALGDTEGFAHGLRVAAATAPSADERALFLAGVSEPRAYARLRLAAWLRARGRWREAAPVLRLALREAKSAAIRDAVRKLRRGPVPVASAPPLFRLNGCGVGLYGSRDAASDGSYVSTYCVSVLWLPVIPITAYRVRSFGATYQFLAREGLGPVARIWRLAALLAAVAALAWYGGTQVRDSPWRKARVALREAAAAEAAGRRDDALERYRAAIRDYEGLVDLSPAAVAVVRIAAAPVPEPCDERCAEPAARVLAAFDEMPPRVRAGAAAQWLSARLGAWADQIGGATLERSEAAVSLLEAAGLGSTRSVPAGKSRVVSSDERFDVAIVGGGLAGLACACETAAAGLSTAVFERGEECGAKSVSGGRLYLGPLAGLLPAFWESAPFERRVGRETLTLVSGATTTSIDLRSGVLEQPACASHTVLRARLDRWLAERATEAGAMVVPQARVDSLVVRGGAVAGVRVGADTIEADAVVAADGALSRLAQQVGLAPACSPERFALGVKEVVSLEPQRLEDRFGLEPGQGAARLLVGDFTRGLAGGGFLYTNRDSVSVGVVVRLDAARAAGTGGPESHALLEALRAVPEIARLLEGGRLEEYAAHLVPEMSIEQAPRRSMPGLVVVGDAAGLVINHGFTVRGMDLALASGVLAGRAIAATRKPEAAASLEQAYEQALRRSFVLRDLEAARHGVAFLSRERMHAHYPRAACGLMEEVMRVGAEGKGRVAGALWRRVRADFVTWQGLRDLWAARRL
jgi:electron transfer flavoprotein-quinone oxidoreductase